VATQGFSKVTIEGPGLPLDLPEHVSVLSRNGTITLRKHRSRDVIHERSGVTGLRTVARRTWEVTFDNGDVWTLRKPRCSSCGGG
jgi:hypothetical protein